MAGDNGGFFEGGVEEVEDTPVTEGVEVADDDVGEVFEGSFDVLDVDVVVGEVYDFAVGFVCGGAVDAGNGLDGVDALHFFIQKEISVKWPGTRSNP